MSAPEVLMEGVVFGESPRWHDGRVWFSDWGANQVIALDPGGGHEVVATVRSFPMCIDFLPDGRLLVVDSAQRRLLRREPDGSLVQHADLSGISRRLRLRAEPRAGPALVRRRPEVGRTRVAATQRAGRGVPGASTGCRETVTQPGQAGRPQLPAIREPTGNPLQNPAGPGPRSSTPPPAGHGPGRR